MRSVAMNDNKVNGELKTKVVQSNNFNADCHPFHITSGVMAQVEVSIL